MKWLREEGPADRTGGAWVGNMMIGGVHANGQRE